MCHKMTENWQVIWSVLQKCNFGFDITYTYVHAFHLMLLYAEESYSKNKHCVKYRNFA